MDFFNAFTLLAVAVVGGVGYIWASRGFLSSLIHMMCVIAAGAIAFAVWEPAAYFLLGQTNNFLRDIAWAVALIVPFAASLAILRVAIDAIVRNNAVVAPVTDLVGGGVCGAVSGVLTAGILIIGLGYLRIGSSFMGYAPVEYSASGSLMRGSTVFPPVDRITAGFYKTLSERTFRTPESLAEWRPSLADDPGMMRVNYLEGSGIAAMRPKDAEVTGRYTVGRAGNIPLNDLTVDQWNERPQKVEDMTGGPLSGSFYIEAFTVRFKAGARERSGKVTVGNGQVSLIVQHTDGSTQSINPFAMVSQAQAAQAALGRWRFDASDVFISSVGGGSEAEFAFEFLTPRGTTPIALMVKGVRYRVDGLQPGEEFLSVDDRDYAIDGQELPGFTELQSTGGTGQQGGSHPDISVTHRFAMRNLVLNKGERRGLEFNDTNQIVEGDARYLNSGLSRNRGLDRALAVREFAPGDDTLIVQINVGLSAEELSMLEPTPQAADGGPRLVNDQGLSFQPIGYIYRDDQETWVRLTPARPIQSKDDLPRLSRSRPSQELFLVFRVNRGTAVVSYNIGDTVIESFDQPILMNARQR